MSYTFSIDKQLEGIHRDHCLQQTMECTSGCLYTSKELHHKKPLIGGFLSSEPARLGNQPLWLGCTHAWQRHSQLLPDEWPEHQRTQLSVIFTPRLSIIHKFQVQFLTMFSRKEGRNQAHTLIDGRNTTSFTVNVWAWFGMVTQQDPRRALQNSDVCL